MIRGLYSAATALDAATQAQEVSSHNLAHATTPGYRQQGLAYESFDRVLGRVQESTGDLTGTRIATTYHDFRSGPIQQTDSPTDLALGDSESFFTLTGPDGPMYSRAGSFQIRPNGQLASVGGYPIQGEAGPLIVPPGSKVRIDAEGQVFADENPVGRLRLTRFDNPKSLTSIGPSLFAAGNDAGPRAANSRVMQGYREGSNVQPAEAMVRMIAGSRYYDAAQRALRTISESLQLNTRPQG